MSVTKRTPGPWTAIGDEVHFAAEDEHDSPLICECGGNEKNARLIAAAPELLAACEAVVARFDGGEIEFGWSVDDAAVVEQARVVVAKVLETPTRIDAHGERVCGDGRPRTTAERWHVDGEPEQDILIMDENRLVVCTVMHGTDEAGEKAAKHTAALLAAAPRLADSVSTLKGMLEEYAGEFLWRRDVREAIVEADAALDEALPEKWR